MGLNLTAGLFDSVPRPEGPLPLPQHPESQQSQSQPQIQSDAPPDHIMCKMDLEEMFGDVGELGPPPEYPLVYFHPL